MKGKRYYDDKHRRIALQEEDRIYLRLHDGDHLPEKPPKKWSQPRAGPFKTKRIVGDLACELELPDQWEIHLVISVRHLVPAHADDFREEEPGPVEGGSGGDQHYEVDFIIRREVHRPGPIPHPSRDC
ncbi:hypothetical protein B0J15DRAFT_555845 [Fusarium solani]|uniref:Uncharacterized protein n=1 Tax=Fusarium solani TaxID=169388 RepID=A0A9P9G1M5_FUSSL|nr:uncharacterized protein B0J15DRAFT_555845 [Fusarium solani]KAH7230851.1 hypothetical protein B0J15DRAFT_555845 [Fusarium solani]